MPRRKYRSKFHWRRRVSFVSVELEFIRKLTKNPATPSVLCLYAHTYPCVIRPTQGKWLERAFPSLNGCVAPYANETTCVHLMPWTARYASGSVLSQGSLGIIVLPSQEAKEGEGTRRVLWSAVRVSRLLYSTLLSFYVSLFFNLMINSQWLRFIVTVIRRLH